MKIPCSSCNQRLEIPEELAGQTIECPACNASLAIPLAAPPPPTSRVEVTTPQAAKPQKPSPRRQTSASPKAASSKKSLIPKLAIAAIVGLMVVGVLIFSSSQSGPSVLESYTGVSVSPMGSKMALDLELRSDNSFVLSYRPLSKNVLGGYEYVGLWKRNTKDLILEGKTDDISVILKIDKKTMKLKSWITEGEETIENQSSKPITFKRK